MTVNVGSAALRRKNAVLSGYACFGAVSGYLLPWLAVLLGR
jgi:hypothetical protein